MLKYVYSFLHIGESPDTEIGRVYVQDMDDWDLPDKTFFWDDNRQHLNFTLDRESGTITMLHGTKAGKYHLYFNVYDRKHTQEVKANVTVRVQNIPSEAVYNSGSIRISGITDEDFIRIYDYKVFIKPVVTTSLRFSFFILLIS